MTDITRQSDQIAALKKLREAFPESSISLLPKPLSKDAKKANCAECGGYHGMPAVHLKYVGHAALTSRLLDVDPLWSWEPMATDDDGLPAYDKSGGLWIRLTVCGMTRIGYGNAASKGYADVGAREKEVIGDALRNAGMRFGCALDLWHKGDLHPEEDDAGRMPDTELADFLAAIGTGTSKDVIQAAWATASVRAREIYKDAEAFHMLKAAVTKKLADMAQESEVTR